MHGGGSYGPFASGDEIAGWLGEILALVTELAGNSGKPGRPPEHTRDSTADHFAMFLHEHGVRVTTSTDGVLAKVIRIVWQDADIFVPADLSKVLKDAVSCAKELPENLAEQLDYYARARLNSGQKVRIGSYLVSLAESPTHPGT